jgi:choline transport protein
VYWSLLAVVIISIVILATSPKTDASYVFTKFQNETGWSDGMAWILGLLQSALSLIGFDAALHMTEEMPRPAEDAPRAILYAVAVGGVT